MCGFLRLCHKEKSKIQQIFVRFWVHFTPKMPFFEKVINIWCFRLYPASCLAFRRLAFFPFHFFLHRYFNRLERAFSGLFLGLFGFWLFFNIIDSYSIFLSFILFAFFVFSLLFRLWRTVFCPLFCFPLSYEIFFLILARYLSNFACF